MKKQQSISKAWGAMVVLGSALLLVLLPSSGLGFAQTAITGGSGNVVANLNTGTTTYILNTGVTRTNTGGTETITLGAAGPATFSLTINGTINQTGTGQGIRTSSNAGNTFTIVVNSGGLLQSVGEDAFKMRAAGTVNLTNNGTIYSGPAYGTTPTTALSTGQALDLTSATGGTITNNAGGVIRADGHDAVRLGSGMSFTNHGTILGNSIINDNPANNNLNTPAGSTATTYSTSEGVSFEDEANSSLDNYGSISGSRHGVEADDAATNITITNRSTGTIIGRNGSGIGFDATNISADNVTIHNYGLIRGDYVGAGRVVDRSGNVCVTNDGDGDGIDLDAAGTINNYAGGQILATGASGYDSSGRANNSEAITFGGGTINNDGTIRGATRGILVNNDSVVSRSGSIATTITNNSTGTIEGQSGYAIRLENKLGTAADNDTITNSGTIIGNGSIPDGSATVYLQDGTTADNNSTGTLDGVSYTGTGSARFIRGDGSAIQMGEGDDILTNTGTITGNTGLAINMEGGADTVNFNGGTITGVINGGTGTDTLALGSGVSSSYGIQNFENINVAAGTGTLSGVVTGTTVTKGGAGTLILSGANTFTGLTTISAGVVQIQNATGLGTTAGGTSIASGARLELANNITVGAEALTLLGTGGGSGALLNVSGSNTFGGDLTLGGATTIGSTSGTLTLTGAIGGAAQDLTVSGAGHVISSGIIDTTTGTLTKTGAGSLTLSGANTFTGDVTITGGTVSVGAIAGNGASSMLGNLSGGANVDKLTLNGGTLEFTASTTADLSTAAGITVGAGHGTLSVSSGATVGSDADIATGGNTFTKSGGGQLTMDGNITGGGTVVVAGGTLLMKGLIADTATVQTQSGGTYHIAASDTIASLTGTGTVFIAASQTLTIGAGGTATYGALSGSGNLDVSGAGAGNTNITLTGGTFNSTGNIVGVTGLNKTGSDTLLLTSAAPTGLNGDPVNVQGGTVVVNGNWSTAGTFTVNSGSILGGSGSVSSLLNNGTLNPGNSPGTLTVVGTYSQGAQGVYIVEMESLSVHDRIMAGDAAVDGTVKPVFLEGYRPRVQDEFEIVTTTHGVTGNYDRIDDSQADLGLTAKWRLRYTDHVYLRVDPWFDNPALDLNSNQKNLAVALNRDSVKADGKLSDAMYEINKLDSASSVRTAYDILSPSAYAGLMDVSFLNSELHHQSISRRMTSVRTGTAPLAFNMLDGSFNGQLAVIGRDMDKIVASPVIESQQPAWSDKLAFFVNGNGAIADQNPMGMDPAGYESGTGGVTLGADMRIGDNITLGIATGYANTDYDMGLAGGEISVDTVPATIFGGVEIGSFFANASVGYAAAWHDGTRDIAVNGLQETASSEFTSDQFNSLLELGYEFRIGRLSITPVAEADYAITWMEGFTETGAGSVGLNIADHDGASLESGLGADISYSIQMGKVSLVPNLFARWKHEFLNDSRDINASFVGGETWFRTDMEDASQDYAVLGGGFGMILGDRVSAHALYRTDLGREEYSNHQIQAGLRISF